MDLDPKDNTEMQFLTKLEGCQSGRLEALAENFTHNAASDSEHGIVGDLSEGKIRMDQANALRRTLTCPKDPETRCSHFCSEGEFLPVVDLGEMHK